MKHMFNIVEPEFLITFETWPKLAQQWLMCVSRWKYIFAVGNNIIIINCAIWPNKKTVQCQIRNSLGQWYAPYELTMYVRKFSLVSNKWGLNSEEKVAG